MEWNDIKLSNEHWAMLAGTAMIVDHFNNKHEELKKQLEELKKLLEKKP